MNAQRIELEQHTALAIAERRLVEWGEACRQGADQLGLPRSSGISRMIEVVKVFETRRRGTKRRKPKRIVVETPTGSVILCGRCGFICFGVDCPRCAGRITASGVATRDFRPARSFELSSSVTIVDGIVARSPAWISKILKRTYLWGQPDRIAAQELRISKLAYRQQRDAALEYVAEQFCRGQ